MIPKTKGYRVERKIRRLFEGNGWIVLRPGASLGEIDLICLKKKKCLLLQIKSTRKNKLYYYGKILRKLAGFNFYLVVDFGYGKIRIGTPKKIFRNYDGIDLKKFIKNINFYTTK